MTTPPTPPTPGKPISASFFARLISWVKSGMLVEGTGYRLRRGPNGTALVIDVAKSATSAGVLPWTFRCTVSEDENGNETRRGGWYYGQAQLGLDAAWFGELGRKYKPETDMQGVPFGIGGTILHCDQTADGNYYLEVHPGYPKIELKRFGLNEIRPTDDPVEDKWFVYIGTVVDAKQVFGIHCVPVIYKYI